MGELERYLGPALRHLRLHGGSRPRKQLDVAAAAGVTRGMLSSYERGKQDPSLRNLDRVLEGLGADLSQLHWAIRMVGARPRAGSAAQSDPRPDSRDRSYPTGPPPPSEVRDADEHTGPDLPGGAPSRSDGAPGPGLVYRAVPVPEPLRPDEERALGQMIAGFLAYVKFNREEEGEDGGEGRGE